MALFTNLRILAYCRRAVVALESLAESQRTLARLAQDEWEFRNAPRPRKEVSISTFDRDGVSKRWEEDQALRRGSNA
jgi:hypothetical protein